MSHNTHYTPLFLLATLSLPATAIEAQTIRNGRGSQQANSSVTLADSLNTTTETYAQKLDSLTSLLHERSRQKAGKMLINPYYFPLFSGTTLLKSQLDGQLGTLTTANSSRVTPKSVASLMPQATPHIGRALMFHYSHFPQTVEYNLTPTITVCTPERETDEEKAALAEKKKVDAAATADAPAKIEQEAKVKDFFAPGDFNITVRKPNFWTFKGYFSLKFMQYYVSDNWYKGGDDYLSMLGEFNLEANYDNKQKLIFTNKLETRLGFQTTSGDEKHKFKTNADLLRLTNKLGLQATKHWYYTVSLQSWTQFYKVFQANTDNVLSDFMSPFEMTASLGMDYKLNKKNGNLSANISPIAVNLKYCDRSNIVGRFGIEEGKHTKTAFGSTATVTANVKFSKAISWSTRFYAFYDYENFKAEWENTLNLSINKYLSTKLFLYPRFDKGVQKKEGQSYFQFNEYLSVGLDLNF